MVKKLLSKKELEQMMNAPIIDEKIGRQTCARLVQEACKGNVDAYALIIDILGEYNN